jgi:CRP-like cAMP-binding protein
MEGAVIGDIQRMAILKSIDIFKDLEIESLYQVLKIAKYVKFSKDAVIVKKDEFAESFYIILEGKAGVFINNELIATIVSGGIIGELGVLDKMERTADVITLCEALVLEFNGDSFISLIKLNNAIAFSMARTLSQRLRNTLRTRIK